MGKHFSHCLLLLAWQIVNGHAVWLDGSAPGASASTHHLVRRGLAEISKEGWQVLQSSDSEGPDSASWVIFGDVPKSASRSTSSLSTDESHFHHLFHPRRSPSKPPPSIQPNEVSSAAAYASSRHNGVPDKSALRQDSRTSRPSMIRDSTTYFHSPRSGDPSHDDTAESMQTQASQKAAGGFKVQAITPAMLPHAQKHLSKADWESLLSHHASRSSDTNENGVKGDQEPESSKLTSKVLAHFPKQPNDQRIQDWIAQSQGKISRPGHESAKPNGRESAKLMNIVIPGRGTESPLRPDLIYSHPKPHLFTPIANHRNQASERSPKTERKKTIVHTITSAASPKAIRGRGDFLNRLSKTPFG